MNENMDETFEIDLKELFELIIARIRLVILVVIMFTVSAYLISEFVITPKYQASARLYVNNNKTSVSQNVTLTDLNTGRELVPLYSEFIESDTVLEQVAAAVSNETNMPFDADELRKILSSGAVNDTALIEITVTTPSPEVSQIIANAVVDIAPDRITEFMDGSSVKVVDYAKLPEEPVSPNVMKNTLIGFVLGIIISIGMIFVMELMDTRVKNEEDLKKLLEYPVIGIIPEISVEENAGEAATA